VNLIVIVMTFVCLLYSINCPTVICFPNMLFILWRDTTSELWTPVHSFTLLLLFTIYSLYLLLCSSYLPLGAPNWGDIYTPSSNFSCVVAGDWRRSSHVNYAPIPSDLKTSGVRRVSQIEFRCAATTRNRDLEPETPFWYHAGTGIWRRSSPSSSPTSLHQPSMIPPSMCE
jgi:hypothetical protein